MVYKFVMDGNMELEEFVKKASGAIQINHKVTLIQQRLWNVLLANAYPDLGKQKKFSMPTEALLKYFPETRNTEHLKECLLALNRIQVQYNLLINGKVFLYLAFVQELSTSCVALFSGWFFPQQ